MDESWIVLNKFLEQPQNESYTNGLKHAWKLEESYEAFWDFYVRLNLVIKPWDFYARLNLVLKSHWDSPRPVEKSLKKIVKNLKQSDVKYKIFKKKYKKVLGSLKES